MHNLSSVVYIDIFIYDDCDLRYFNRASYLTPNTQSFSRLLFLYTYKAKPGSLQRKVNPYNTWKLFFQGHISCDLHWRGQETAGYSCKLIDKNWLLTMGNCGDIHIKIFFFTFTYISIHFPKWTLWLPVEGYFPLNNHFHIGRYSKTICFAFDHVQRFP